MHQYVDMGAACAWPLPAMAGDPLLQLLWLWGLLSLSSPALSCFHYTSSRCSSDPHRGRGEARRTFCPGHL